MIISTHDVDLAYSWADRAFVLDRGRILKEGFTEQVFKDSGILKKAKLNPPWVLETWEKMAENGIISHELPVPRTREQLYKMMAANRTMQSV